MAGSRHTCGHVHATGSLSFSFAWPAGLPSGGGVLYWQHWIPDPA